ncbi:hypothetical protein JYU15_01520, partial [bacterium AH-315-I18]|nr:hypothetical protein [bacterium AH-315-I18]
MFYTSRYWLYFALGLYLLSLTGAMLTSQPTAPTSDLLNTNNTKTTQSLKQKQVVGFSLNVHYTDQMPKYFRAIDNVADLGCNSLQILTPAFQTHGASTQISIPNKPGRSPQSDQLLKLLRYAQKRHLKTLLMPTILF